ncbi:replication initiation protein [Chryseobacterium sp. LC2016-29]|uniref:RepB family plasmid replication initiator protein n=1 Tax=Chryseobacterium sp. LC2016-29 TaxID=2897331 RepID=UPI001E62DC57|nr:RepB family plasmid replication initiator protein [Chryseobacterium sp. LC2016-29]MCD0477454.1 replication initiation protein [Chryseobacterium sp. LC2016-29]
MNSKKSFTPVERKKVLISNDFREILLTQDTTIIEQRLIVMILSSIKDEQSMFISVKSPIDFGIQTQLSFDDCFDGWANQGTVDFIIPLKDLNPERKMKNKSIKTALINMTNINWLQLKDDSINGFRAVPFILEPGWNRTNIFFKMDKAVMKHLLNMSHYFPLRKDLPYKASSTNTLRFLMWIIKFRKFGGVTKNYTEILKELYIPTDKYEGRSRFERDFLLNIKADLDFCSDLSFNYSYKNDKYSFVIYDTGKAVGFQENFKSLNELQIDRALKYIKKKRALDEAQIRVLKDLYLFRGYDELSKRIKSKVSPSYKGRDYIKAVLVLLAK